MKLTLILASALLLAAPAVAATDAAGAAEYPCYSQSHDVGSSELRFWGGSCIGVGYTIDGPSAVCDRERVCHADHVFEPAPAAATSGSCYVYRTHDLVVAEVREWGGYCVGVGYTVHGCGVDACENDWYVY